MFVVCSSVNDLSSEHPSEQTDCGESASNCLGVAQFEKGGSRPVGHNSSSHRRRQPMATEHTPVRSGLTSRSCCLPFCCCDRKINTEVTSSGRGPGKIMEILIRPIARIILLALLAESDREVRPIQSVTVKLQGLPEVITVLCQPHSGLRSEFPARLDCPSRSFCQRQSHGSGAICP